MDRSDDRGDALAHHLERLEGDLESLVRDLRTGDELTTIPRARFEAVAGRLQSLLAETNGGHGSIDTQSGRQITPLEADPDDISLADIACALSNLTRFAGHASEHYSVARHSVHVSREVEARGGSPAAIRWGLLHDATEAYLADVPAPVKRSLPGYTRAEARLAETVRERFGLEPTRADLELVDAADGDVGRWELAAQFPDRGYERPSLECDPVVPEADADDERLFLRRARTVDCE